MRTNVLHVLRKDSKAEQTVSRFIQRDKKGGDARTKQLNFLAIKHSHKLTKQKGQNLAMKLELTLELTLELLQLELAVPCLKSFSKIGNTF